MNRKSDSVFQTCFGILTIYLSHLISTLFMIICIGISNSYLDCYKFIYGYNWLDHSEAKIDTYKLNLYITNCSSILVIYNHGFYNEAQKKNIIFWITFPFDYTFCCPYPPYTTLIQLMPLFFLLLLVQLLLL